MRYLVEKVNEPSETLEFNSKEDMKAYFKTRPYPISLIVPPDSLGQAPYIKEFRDMRAQADYLDLLHQKNVQRTNTDPLIEKFKHPVQFI
jgi:hypothetical protein